MAKVPGLTRHESERLSKLEVIELRGFATPQDVAELEWLRKKIDRRKMPSSEDRLVLTREAARQLGRDTVKALEQGSKKILYLEDYDED